MSYTQKMYSRHRSAKEVEIERRVTIPTYFAQVIVPQLGSYYSNYPVNFDVKDFVCCPLHDEDTPSFKYYSETNTYYCFGCGAGGPSHGVVSLHMKFTEKMAGTRLTRQEAVDSLYNYFILERSTNDNFVAVKGVKKVESTQAELIQYSLYKSELEKSLAITKSISQDKLIDLWDFIDKIEVLVSINEVGAIEAKEAIQNKVMEAMKDD